MKFLLFWKKIFSTVSMGKQVLSPLPLPAGICIVNIGGIVGGGGGGGVFILGGNVGGGGGGGGVDGGGGKKSVKTGRTMEKEHSNIREELMKGNTG